MQDDKKRMSVWVTPEDREAMKIIARHLGLGSESAALRYAVLQVAREIKAKEQAA
jgi:hypothetical protein